MIIDVNATLGPYPFRSLRCTTADALVAQMDRNGIDRAVVSGLPTLFYRDAHRGNEELFAAVRPHASRLIPVVTVNPRYAGWERDFAQAVDAWRARIVMLAPEYHGYALGDEHGQAALARIAERGVTLMLVQRFEDRRQRHAWDRAEDLTTAAVLEAARRHRELKFLLVNWLGLDGAKLAEAGLRGRCLIDLARLQVAFRKEVPKLIETLGAESVAFGTHQPFEYVAPSLVKLDDLRVMRPADYEAIAWRNAARFLGL